MIPQNHENSTLARLVFGDRRRIFLNHYLGCRSRCSYCYLPKLGIAIGQPDVSPYPPVTVANAVINWPSFEKGRNGTILSIGCYSECWDPQVRRETKKLILHLLPLGNPIQLSTKRAIELRDIEYLRQKQVWEKQLNIYISCATISQWQLFEAGTSSPARRFNSLRQLMQVGLTCFLYIKPVLQGITIRDISEFVEVVEMAGISVIVGDEFSTEETDRIAPVGENILFQKSPPDAERIRARLAEYSTVYETSIDPILKLRTLRGLGQRGTEGDGRI